MKTLVKILVLCLLPSLPGFSQISGRIIDSGTNEALAGANIRVDSGFSAISNSGGFFTIPSQTGFPLKLSVSFIGYAGKQIEITVPQSDILITLDPEPGTIGEVTVSVSGFSEKISRSTWSVGLVSYSNLQLHNNVTLNDAVNLVPGLNMSSGTYNTNRLTIRGIGSRSPYSSNRIKAYLNDIPLTTGDGTTNIEDIDMAGIGRIEVIKGPSSAVYGSGLGGAVRIWTTQPENEGFSISSGMKYGSFGTYNAFLRTAFKTDRGNVSLIYSKTHSDGYRQNSEYNRHSLFLTSGLEFYKSAIKYTLLYTDVNAQIPSSVNYESFRTNPRLAAPNWLAIKGYEKYRKLLAGISLQNRFNNTFSNKASVFASLSDPYEPRPFNILDEFSRSGGIQEQINISAGKVEFMAGAEIFLEAYNWKIFKILGGKQGDLQADNHEKRFYINSFALSRYRPNDKLTAEFGFNLNVLHYSLTDNFQDSIDLGGEYQYKPVLSPRFGLNYELRKDAYLHASAGHGFSAPSLEETLLPAGQINTNLKPETGWNMDAGIRGKILSGRINYDFSLYYISLHNLLVTKRISEEIFTGINAGKTFHSGFEGLLGIDLLSPEIKKIKLNYNCSFSASVNRFKDFKDNGTDYSGKKLPGIPSAIIYNELKMKLIDRIEISYINRFTGKQYMNDLNSEINESWWLNDIRVDFNTGSEKKLRLKLYAGIKNLFDKRYAGMILVNAPSAGTIPPRYFYPGLPRNYFAGMEVQF